MTPHPWGRPGRGRPAVGKDGCMIKLLLIILIVLAIVYVAQMVMKRR